MKEEIDREREERNRKREADHKEEMERMDREREADHQRHLKRMDEIKYRLPIVLPPIVLNHSLTNPTFTIRMRRNSAHLIFATIALIMHLI